MIRLAVVPCGILSLALARGMELFRQHELQQWSPANSTALVTSTPPPQPEIPAGPETPAERRSRERAAKHETNQAQLRRSWQKDREQEKWEEEHRDGLGRLPLGSLIESSPRCLEFGVHYPKPIVFPEDLPKAIAPNPQPKALPPPEPPMPQPHPVPEREPYDEEEYQRLLADLRASLGIPHRPTYTSTSTNSGNTQQPGHQPTSGAGNQPGTSQPPPPGEPKKEPQWPYPCAWHQPGMLAADVWMAHQPSSTTTS